MDDDDNDFGAAAASHHHRQQQQPPLYPPDNDNNDDNDNGWYPFVGQRFDDPDEFLQLARHWAKTQHGFRIGKSYTYDKNPTAIARNGGVAPVPKGVIYCAALKGGNKTASNPCPWRLQFGYRARTMNYEVTKLLAPEQHCGHVVGGNVEYVPNSREKYDIQNCPVVPVDRNWQPHVGERFTDPGHFLGMVRSWSQQVGFKVARSFCYVKTPSLVQANGGVEPIQKGIIYCNTLPGSVQKNPCPCRVQFGYRSKTKDYEVVRVETEHCHLLGGDDPDATYILPGAKQREVGPKKSSGTQQQQQHSYATAETMSAPDWTPKVGLKFSCPPEQFVELLNQYYASRWGFVVGSNVEYANKNKNKNADDGQQVVVQKGVIFCKSQLLEGGGRAYNTPCPFHLKFNYRTKTKDYHVTKVVTEHCHAINDVAVESSTTAVPPVAAAAATTAESGDNAQYTALMARSEQLCRLASSQTTPATSQWLMTAFENLETQMKDMNNNNQGQNQNQQGGQVAAAAHAFRPSPVARGNTAAYKRGRRTQQQHAFLPMNQAAARKQPRLGGYAGIGGDSTSLLQDRSWM